MVCCCPLILMVTISLGYSFWSFVKLWCDTLFVYFTWRSTDSQTSPKCPFLLLQRLQLALRALQQPACGTFSPQYLQISIVSCLFPNVLSSSWMVVSAFGRRIWHRLQWYGCWSWEYCFSRSPLHSSPDSMIKLLRPAWQGPYPSGQWIMNDYSFSECVCNVITSFMASSSPILSNS